MKTGEEERLHVLGVVGAGYNTTRKDILLFITLFGRQVQQNPDINPTIRLLVSIQLCTVHRKHQDTVVRPNISPIHSLKVVLPMVDVAIFWDGTAVGWVSQLLEYLASFSIPMMHEMCGAWLFPSFLKLGSEGHSIEVLARFLGLGVISCCKAIRAFLKISVGPSVCHTGVRAHIVDNRCNTSQSSHLFLDPIKREDVPIGVVFQDIQANVFIN